MVQTCSEPTGLGEINDDELNRIDWELEKGFNEALQSEKDFMNGVRVGFLKNMTKLPFNLAGFVLNSREVQDMPDKLESSDVEDERAYVGGKITADVVTTVLGIIGIVSGVGQMVTGLAGDVGGGALCASGVGIPAGVAVVAGSTTLVVAGAAEVAASASLVYSSVSNLGRDVDELKESKKKKETASSEADTEAKTAVEKDNSGGNSSPKGLIGHDFEDYLTENVGGNGSFSVGGRDFDGGINNRWWEAKSGQYWDMLESNPNKLAKFKSDMGDRLRIATDNGATYELFSNTPIPDSIKQWLIKKGISYTELLN